MRYNNISPNIFDWQELMSRVGDDEELCKELITIFMDNMPKHIDDLKASLDKNDTKGVRFHAHTIKGLAANISAYTLHEIAYEAQNAGEKGEFDKLRLLIKKMSEEFGEFQRELSRYNLIT